MRKNGRKGPVPKPKSAGPSHRQKLSASNKSGRCTSEPASETTSGLLKSPKTASKVVDPCIGELAIRESRAILQALMNASVDALTVLDRDGTFLEVNPIVCKRFGLSRETLLGRSAWELFPVQVTEQRKAAFEKAHQSSNMVRFEDERDGRQFDHVIYPVVESDGVINKFVIFARDITESKKTEKPEGGRGEVPPNIRENE